MTRRVLHILSQRPEMTGSGVTLQALTARAAESGWRQSAAVGLPAAAPLPEIPGLEQSMIHPLRFGAPPLDFHLPGMSDVMPYPSTPFSSLTPAQVSRYGRAWRDHLLPVIETFRPDLVHVHHIWIVAALIKDLAPRLPVVNHCHGTGLRQMALCPELAQTVRTGCRRNERFAVLHRQHADQLAAELELEARDRVRIVGAGYREDLFQIERDRPRKASLVFVGKLSEAKGLPWLLDAVGRLSREMPGLVLHVVGSGSGPEARTIERRMAGRPAVIHHGHLDQRRLARLLGGCTVCVLPSLYEGLPLVLVEALACGCRLVSTRLPGVVEGLATLVAAELLELVDPPALEGVDRPLPRDLPAFVDRLSAALHRALQRGPAVDAGVDLPRLLRPFTWRAVFDRVQRLWRELAA